MHNFFPTQLPANSHLYQKPVLVHYSAIRQAHANVRIAILLVSRNYFYLVHTPQYCKAHSQSSYHHAPKLSYRSKGKQRGLNSYLCGHNAACRPLHHAYHKSPEGDSNPGPFHAYQACALPLSYRAVTLGVGYDPTTSGLTGRLSTKIEIPQNTTSAQKAGSLGFEPRTVSLSN